MPTAGLAQDYGNGSIRLLHYDDRGRSAITPRDVLEDLTEVAELIGDDRDLARISATWVPPRLNIMG